MYVCICTYACIPFFHISTFRDCCIHDFGNREFRDCGVHDFRDCRSSLPAFAFAFAFAFVFAFAFAFAFVVAFVFGLVFAFAATAAFPFLALPLLRVFAWRRRSNPKHRLENVVPPSLEIRVLRNDFAQLGNGRVPQAGVLPIGHLVQRDHYIPEVVGHRGEIFWKLRWILRTLVAIVRTKRQTIVWHETWPTRPTPIFHDDLGYGPGGNGARQFGQIRDCGRMVAEPASEKSHPVLQDPFCKCRDCGPADTITNVHHANRDAWQPLSRDIFAKRYRSEGWRQFTPIRAVENPCLTMKIDDLGSVNEDPNAGCHAEQILLPADF